MASSSEHVIKIQVDANNGRGLDSSSTFDVGPVANAIENTLNSSMKSLENTISTAIKNALSNISPSKGSIAPSDSSSFSKSLAKDIREAIVDVVNKSTSSSTPVSTKDVQKDISQIIKTTLSDQLGTFLKSQGVSNEATTARQVVKSVTTSIPKQETNDISKIALELSSLVKELSNIPILLKDLVKERSKESPDNTKLITILEGIINSSSSAKESYKAVKTPISRIDIDNSTGALETLSSLNKALTKAAKEAKDIFAKEITVKVNVDTAQAHKDISNIVDKSTTITVDADTDKASSKINSILKQDNLLLGIDLDKEDISSIYNRVLALQNQVKGLGSKGVKIEVDTSALQDLQNMLVKLVQDYDYVKSALGLKQKQLQKSLAEDYAPERINKLPEKERTVVENKARFAQDTLTKLENVLNSMHKVADRKPEYYSTPSNNIPSSALTIDSFKNIGTLKELQSSLASKDVGTLVTASQTHKIRTDAVRDTKAIEGFTANVNSVISKLGSSPEITSLTSAIKDNTASNIETVKALQGQAKVLATSNINNLRDFRFDVKYPSGIIQPGMDYKPSKPTTNEYELKVYDNLAKLASSLDRLQNTIYTKVSQGLSTQGRFQDWRIVENNKNEAGPRSAFSLRGRDWAMDVVDMKKLRSLTGQQQGTPKELLQSYTDKITTNLLHTKGATTESVKAEVSDWLSSNIKAVGSVEKLPEHVKASLGKAFEKLSGITSKDLSATNVKNAFAGYSNPELGKIYAETVGFSDVQKQLATVRRTIAIPAAKLTETGSTILETKSGSQRSTLNVAEYKTGFERAFEHVLSKTYTKFQSQPGEAAKVKFKEAITPEILLLSKAARNLSTTTSEQTIVPDTDKSYEEVSRLLLKRTAGSDTFAPSLNETADFYKKALAPISIERQRITKGTSYELSAKEEFTELTKQVDSAIGSSKSIEDFMDKMESLGISATKVLKSLDSLNFSNMYDTIERATAPKIDKIVSNIATSTGAIGDFEKAISKLEGAMPIAGTNTPRRAMHQGDVVSTMFNYSKAFSLANSPEQALLTDAGKDLYAEDLTRESNRFNLENKNKKAFITNQNRRFNELFYEQSNLDVLGNTPAALSRKAALNVGLNKQLSSLGLPESTASDLTDFDTTKGLPGRSLSMYTGNLREIAPFALEYQQTGRNISGISSAKSFDPGLFAGAYGIKSEMPRLRSESEDKAIKAGRFGTSGIGYNVLAELRHTAGTFEDQILISGKLADAATTAVKKLVRPKAVSGKATALTPHVLKDEDIAEASTNIMSIMGVEEQYKRRPTKAFMTDVRNEVMTNRGASVEVQTAKLAELFLNHFGRKLTTRYGSKGVSVTPTSPSSLGDILANYKDTPIKVATGDEQQKAGLGVALMPKSIGELASDILGKQDTTTKDKIAKELGVDVDTLSQELKASGNKFILDIFSNVERGLVTESEALKNIATFDKARKAFKLLDIDIEQNIQGIEAIKSAHTGPKTTARAIDVRISSYGAAKRGLQTEPLEMITNNLAGSTDKETVLKNVIDDQKNKLISGKGSAFSSYSKALGFSGSGKSREEIAKRINAMFSDKDKEKKSVQDTINAMIELESNSSFYVDVIDELDNSKKRKSLVGEKFLTIVEEATQTEEWSKGAIESLNKGLKLNIPAYAAYTTIFGEDSKFITSLNDTFSDKQAEHYDNILTYLVSTNEDYKKKVLGSVSKIDIKQLKSINKDAAKTFDETDPNSLVGTLFDTDKFPAAYTTTLPSTKGPEEPGEDFYIPRSISRAAFADPNEAGAYGLKNNASKLQEVIEKAKSLEAFYKKDPSLLLDTDITGMSTAFGSRVGSDLKPFVDKYGVEQVSQTTTQEQIDTIKQSLMNLLDRFNELGKISTEAGSLDPQVKTWFNRSENVSGKLTTDNASQTDLYNRLKTPEGFNSKTALAAMKNLLVGTGQAGSADTSILGKATDKDTRLSILTGVSSALNSGNVSGIFSYGASKGASREEQYDFQVKKRQEDLEKAKNDYQQALKSTLVGKQGSVARTFFTRNIPSVLAKAVNATVDKTEDLKVFSEALKSFDDLDLSGEISKIDKITAEHAANVAKYKKQGMPVLKQHEIGISAKMAEKLKVDFTKKYDEGTATPLDESKEISGSLLDLLEYTNKLKISSKKLKNPYNKANINSYINEELAPYVESVRFPFTGTSSVKPYLAKLTKTKGGIGDESLIVPGAPEMDMGAFEEVYASLQDKLKGLTSEREAARVVGDDAKADKLTVVIDKLNTAISNVLPKYVAHAQKLDYDGDQLELHTAKTSEAREEIYKHFKMLTEDISSTSGKFSDFYAYDAKQPTQGDLPLAFMAKAFTKKFDTTKGYSFLDKPFMTEDLSYLTGKEKIGILASKEQELAGVSGDEAVNRVLRPLFKQVGENFSDIKGVEDLDTAAGMAASALEVFTKSTPKKGAFIEGLIKEELLGVKSDTAVNAQLFKINTGTDVESMTKLMRAYESKRGFGDLGGDIGLYERTKSKGLNTDFVVRERNTQLNEFFRFAVQKGMDVKHAGEQPIAEELVKGVTTGSVGLSDLLTKLNTKDSYKDLKKFSDINAESLRSTLGRFSTQELKDQITGGGFQVNNLESLDRTQLVDVLVGKLGFEGFLRDLQLTIEQMAIEGLKATNPKITDDKAAKAYLSKRYEEGEGVNVSRLITNVKDPLYKYRTDSVKIESNFDEEFQNALSSVDKSYKDKGAYAELVRNFDNLFKEGTDKTSFVSAKNMLDEAFAGGPISPVKSLLSGMENTLGLAPISAQGRAAILQTPEHIASLKDIPEQATSEEKAAIERENIRLDDLALAKARLDRIASVSNFRADISNVPKDLSIGNAEIKSVVDKMVLGMPKSTASDLPPMLSVPNILNHTGANVDLTDVMGPEPPIPGSFYAGSTVPPEPPTPGDSLKESFSGNTPLPVFIEGFNNSLIFPVKLIGQLLSSANISRDIEQQGLFKSEGAEVGNVVEDVNKFKSTETQRREAASKAARTLEPVPGSGPDAELANLQLLRDASKALYESRGMDFNNEAKKLTQEAQDFINNAKEMGAVEVTEFLKYTKDASILNRQDPNQGMPGKDIADAWRLYKDAVVEFLLNKAEDAKSFYESVKGVGGSKETLAYNKYLSAVKAVQTKITGDVGKRSDIYTSNMVWSFPDIAKAAGVFQSPSDIQRRSNRDLGSAEDPDSELLTRVFNNITDDLSGKSRGSITAPADKARKALKELTDMNTEMVALMENGKLLERLGPEIADAWDFEKAAERLTRLRSSLELFKKYNVSDSPMSVEKKNLEETIKFLKDAENKLTKVSMSRKIQPGGAGVWGETGVVQIPKWADPEMQMNLHKRNIAKLREYYGKSEEEGGAKVGERYSYDVKVFDDAGKAVVNQRNMFHKFSESVDQAGQKVGLFNETQKDLAASLAGANSGFMGAIERAVKWGAAATVIYGGASQIKEAVKTLAEIEVSMAQLRMVLPKQGTDFEGLQKEAVGMAKKYGTPTTGVLESMTIYAQQGLDVPAILDRTDTSMMAVNVTTLKAKEATEALTSAMKIFRSEGERSMRFLDAWSEVEALHAITANDMAQAIQKSAAAASAAGVTFDQLNGIVAAIGSVTRQSGKEVGTSLRFIMRRLSAEKGPEALAKLNIPTVTGEGELRGGYDILGDLAKKWRDLTTAQRMAVAQAIGGTRQYNSVLVLMENWQEAIDGVHHSMNSQGSAARRNAEMMQTYAKQVEQTKAAFLELQLAFGKIAFPAAKMGLQGLRALAETINAIPNSFKAAGVAAVALFTYLSQGAKILDAISNFFSGGTPILGGLITSIKDELKTASFELVGAGQTDESTRGLKTVNKDQVSGVSQGKSLKDFESVLGKTVFMLTSLGKNFNDTVGGTLKGTGDLGQKAGQGLVRTGSWFSSIVSALGGGKYGKGEDVTYKDLAGGVASKFAKSEGIKGAFAAGGLKGLGKIASSFVGVATEVGGLGAAAAGIFVDEFSKKLGAGGDIFKSWAQDNAGVIKAVAPMLLTLGLLTPAIKALGTEFLNATRSSQDFEDSMYELRIADEQILKQTRNTTKTYKELQSRLGDVSKSTDPAVSANQKHLGTYVHPLTALTGVQADVLKLNESIAQSNIGMIVGYDKLGNAVLRAAENYQSMISAFERGTIRDLAARDIQVAAKHIESLTKTDGPEAWKSELKDLTKEIPVIGGLISDQIKLSPAKGLELATGKLNKLVAQKNASPFSTAYDEDIKDLQAKLTKVKTSFNQTYSDFRRNLSNIPTAGLGKDEIADLLGAKELRAGYQLIVDIEPKYNVKDVKDKVKWEDVLGAEVLKRVFPESNFIDATKELSTANIETAGVRPREGKVLSGDLVTFMDDATEKYNMAGKQAIVKLKETSDGVFEWVATYFNTKTLKVEERAFDSSLQSMVDAILPTRAIKEDLSDRIDSLGTFVTGASAGLVGLAKKGFKTDFDLGERFFSDITTSTIIQGEKGFDPLAGFGDSKFQKTWSEDFKKYYSEPMTEYKNSIEEIKKLSLEGIDKSSIEMSTELYESIVKLQKVLMNNQVVLQYRAVFADLTKTLEANTRAVKENIAVEKTRSTLAVETSGLLKGKDASLANIDLGKYDKNTLTAQERLLINNSSFGEKSSRLKELDIRKSGIAEQLYAADRSKVALESIKTLSAGFGTTLEKADLAKYTETVAKTGDLGIAELKIDTNKTAENTAATVDRLDQILDNLNDTKGIQEMESKSLDSIAAIRDKAVRSGDNETIIKANKALDDLSRKLVDRLGLEGAVEEANSGLFGPGAFTGKELVQRAFGGMDFKTLASEMRSTMNGKEQQRFDESTQAIFKMQEENAAKAKETPFFNSKTLAGATTAFGVYQAFNSNFSNKKVEAYEKEIADLKKRKDEVGFIDYDDQMTSLVSAKAEEEKKARMYGTMRFAAGGASGSMLLARNLGLSDDAITRLGAGGAALGVYGAAKLQQGMTGDDLPPLVKEFGKEVGIFANAMKSEGIFSALKKGSATERFKQSSEEFMRQFAEETLDLKVTPRATDTDRQTKFNTAYDVFDTAKENLKFDAEWKAKEFKRSVENPNANLRENTRDYVNQKVDDLKNKFSTLKDDITTSSKEAIKDAAQKMASGETVDLKDEASQIYRGAKIKTKAAYEDLKSGASEAADFAGKTAKYSGEAALGAFDALKEAITKNTGAVDRNTEATSSTPGNSFGGLIQKFATGGTVKQMVPGEGDVQPALLTAGEKVLTKDQFDKLKDIFNVVNPTILDERPEGKPTAFDKLSEYTSGKINDKVRQEIGEEVYDNISKIQDMLPKEDDLVKRASGGWIGNNIEKLKAFQAAAEARGEVSFEAAGTMYDNAKFDAEWQYRALANKYGPKASRAFESAKAMGSASLGTIQDAISGRASKALSLGKAGLKKVPGLGFLVSAAGATERAATGDYLGAGLEAASGLVSTIPGIGTAVSFGLDAILMGKDTLTKKLPSLDELKSKKSDIYSKLGKYGSLAALGAAGAYSMFSEDEQQFAGGGFISTGLKGLGKLLVSGTLLGATGLIGAYKGVKKILSSDAASGITSSAIKGTSSAVKNTSDNYKKFKDINPSLYEAIATGTIGTAGYTTWDAIYGDDPDMYEKYGYENAHGGFIGRFADGGYTTGMIRGAGTGTSDSIYMSGVPDGSFIVPAKYANKAKDAIDSVKLVNGGKSSSDIRVSNGELFISPEDAEKIGSDNLRKMQLGQEPKFAAGGFIRGFQDGGNVASSDTTVSIDPDSISRFAQATAAASAYTFAKYAAGKTGDETRIADLNNLAENENTAIYEAIMSNSEASQRVLDTLRTNKTTDAPTAEMEEVSKVLDSGSEYNKTLEDINEVQKELNAEYEVQMEEVAKLKEELRQLEIAEKFAMQLESMNKAVKDNQFAEEFKRSLKVGTGAFEGFAGPRTDLNLDTKSAMDLSGLELTQLVGMRKEDQRYWYQISTYLEPLKNFGLRTLNLFNPEDTYNNKYRGQNVLKEFSTLEDEKTALNSMISASLQNRSQATSEEEFEKWNDRLKELGQSLEEVTKKQDGYAVALREQIRAVESAQRVLIEAKEAAIAVTNIKSTATYGLNNRGVAGLRGAIGDLSLMPLGTQDLTSPQYAHLKAGRGMQEDILKTKVNTTLYDQEFQRYSELGVKREEALAARRATSDRGILFKDNAVQEQDNIIKDLDKRLSESKTKLDSIGNSIYQASIRISNFFAATEAAKNFENALINVKASFNAAEMGVGELSRSIAKLYGGSNPNAPQYIDIEEREAAAKVGITLESGKSSQLERDTARYLSGFINSTDPETAEANLRNYQNMDQRRADLKQAEKFEDTASKNREVLTAGETYVKDLALAKARIDDRIRANKYTDYEPMGDSKSRQADVIASGILDTKGNEFTKYLTAQAEIARETNTDISETTRETLRSMTDSTTDALGGKSIDMLNKSFDSSPMVSAIETQTTNLIAGLVTPDALNNALEFLKVEKSPTFFDKASETASKVMNFKAFEQNVPIVDIYAQKAARDAKAAEIKYLPDNFATGGSIGTLISGPGTGTSDDISMSVPAGSFIIKAQYAKSAKDYINSFASGGQVPVNVSNGELLLTPEEVAKIGGADKAKDLNKGFFEKLRDTILSKQTEAVILGSETSKNITNKEKALKDLANFAFGGEVPTPDASWTDKDYNQYGFANAKDYEQQMGGLQSPMLDPVDLVGGFGAAALTKVFSSKLMSTLAKPLANEAGNVALPSLSSSYLREAKNIMGVNLDVSKYTKEIISDKALLNEVLTRGRKLYGEEASIAQIVTRSGPIGIKNLVENIKGFASGGYVTDSGLSISGASDEDLERFIYGRAGRLRGVANVVNGLEISGDNRQEIDRFIYGRAGKPNKSLPTITSSSGLEIQTASLDNFKKLVNQGDTISFPGSGASSNINDALANVVSKATVTTKLVENVLGGLSKENSSSLPVEAAGISLDKVAEKFSATLSKEKHMLPKTSLISESSEDLMKNISEIALSKKADVLQSKSVNKDLGFIQSLTTANENEERVKQELLSNLTGKLGSIKEAVVNKEKSMDEPTLRLVAKQFDATRIGAAFSQPTERWTNIKGLTTMLGTKNGPAFVADRGTKSANIFTSLQEKLAYVSKDTPERAKYLQTLSEDRRNSFNKALEVIGKDLGAVNTAGGYEGVLRNQTASLLFSKAKQNFDVHLGGFYYKDIYTKAKEKLDKNPGKYVRTYDRATEFDIMSQASLRAQTDQDFAKSYLGGYPNKSALSEDTLLLLQKLLKSQNTNTEIITRNNNSSQVRHNGGLIGTTGKYFLEQGELVIPKGFKDGGQASFDSVPYKASSQSFDRTVELEGLDTFEKLIKDFEKTVEKVSSIKIEGLDKLTDIKIEGISELKNIQIEGLDKLTNIKIEGIEQLRDIRIEGLNDLRDIKVEGLDQLRDINILGIEALKDIKVDLTGRGSVGADSSDMLAETLKEFDSRVSNLESSSSSQIEIIRTTVVDMVNSMPEKDIMQKSDIADIRKEISETNSEIINLSSSMKRLNQEFSAKVKELSDRQNTAMTHIYSIKRG